MKLETQNPKPGTAFLDLKDDYNRALRARRRKQKLALTGISVSVVTFGIALGRVFASIPPGQLLEALIIAAIIGWAFWGIMFLALEK